MHDNGAGTSGFGKKPDRVHEFVAKGHRYFRFRWPNKARRSGYDYIALGKDRSVAYAKAHELNARLASEAYLMTAEQRYIASFVKQSVRLKRASAKRLNQVCTLTEEDIDDLLRKQGYRCAISGLPFEFNKGSVWNATAQRNRHPFAPSIDRIRAGGPYSKDNCRIVSLIANLAMSNFGEDALIKLCGGVLGRVSHARCAPASR